MHPQVFVSYRRDDSAHQAGRLASSLRSALGDDAVFLDTNRIEMGENWPSVLEGALASADVLVVILGAKWLTTADKYGIRRIDQDDDWVRREIEIALARGIRIVPLCVDGPVDIPPDTLPSSIREFAHLQRLDVRPAYWDHDVKLLISSITSASNSPRTGRTVGLRPAGTLEHWRDREEVRNRLADLILHGERVISLIGRRGVGKSGVVTKVASDLIAGQEPGRPVLDGVVYLSTRTGTTELTLDRIFHQTSALLSGTEQTRLAQRFAANRIAAFPELFQALGDDRILVVLDNVDDLQDPQTGSFLTPDVPAFLNAVATAPTAPVVMTTSQRALRLMPDTDTPVKQLELHDGLEPEDAISLLRQMDADGRAGTAKMDTETLSTLVERVGGIPRGLQLVIAHLRDYPMSGRRKLVSANSAPDELLRALVSDAFDRLTGATRMAVETIAVAGVPLSIEALVAVIECPAEEVEEALDELVAARELMCGDDGLLRLHPLDTDYVRLRLSPERHAQLDIRLADWYANCSSERSRWRRLAEADCAKNEYRHRMRGGQPERALQVLAQAAAFIARHGDAEFLRTAVRRAEPLCRDSPHSAVCMAFAEFFAGDLEKALSLFKRLAAGREPTAEWRMWTGVTLRFLHRTRDAVAVLSPIAHDDKVPRLLRLRVAFELGLVHCYQRDVAATAQTIDLFEKLQRVDDPDLVRAWYYDLVALRAVISGRPHEVIPAAVQSAAHFVGTSEADNATYAHNLHGVALLTLGRWQEAIEPLTTAADDAAALGLDRPEGLARTNLAWALCFLERWPEAEESAQLASRRLLACREPGATGLMHLVQAIRDSKWTDVGGLMKRVVDELQSNPDLYHPGPQRLEEIALARRARPA